MNANDLAGEWGFLSAASIEQHYVFPSIN